MGKALETLNAHPRAGLISFATPLERLERLSTHLGIDLWIKRDDLTGLGFGGNKIRQVDFYLGDALTKGADTILITGAVQSNYVRCAAAGAARFGMDAILQLEERVSKNDPAYRQSGNVLLDKILGAELMHYPEGEDEAGADKALAARADELRAAGKTPYIIPLGLTDHPLGGLGYAAGAGEILDQMRAFEMPAFDAFIVPSGSGLTHGGLMAGLRANGDATRVIGVCVRRDANAQKQRMAHIAGTLSTLLETPGLVGDDDLHLHGAALPPGYGKIGAHTAEAIRLMARMEGLFVDPVYSAKTLAGLIQLVQSGEIAAGSRILLIHTGGLPAIFAYGEDLVSV